MKKSLAVLIIVFSTISMENIHSNENEIPNDLCDSLSYQGDEMLRTSCKQHNDQKFLSIIWPLLSEEKFYRKLCYAFNRTNNRFLIEKRWSLAVFHEERWSLVAPHEGKYTSCRFGETEE